MNRYPGDVGRDAVEMLIELLDLYRADVLVGSEQADDALDHAAYALHRAGVLDDLIRRQSQGHNLTTSQLNSV